MYWTLFRSHVDWHRLVRSTILFIHVKLGSVTDYSKTPTTNTRHCLPVHGDFTNRIKYLTTSLTNVAATKLPLSTVKVRKNIGRKLRPYSNEGEK